MSWDWTLSTQWGAKEIRRFYKLELLRLNWEDDVGVTDASLKPPGEVGGSVGVKSRWFLSSWSWLLTGRTQGLSGRLPVFTGELLNWRLTVSRWTQTDGGQNWGQCSWCLFYNRTCFLITSFHCQPRITVQYTSFCLWLALTNSDSPTTSSHLYICKPIWLNFVFKCVGYVTAVTVPRVPTVLHGPTYRRTLSNPGTHSCIHKWGMWKPAFPGYPRLTVKLAMSVPLIRFPITDLFTRVMTSVHLF